MGWDWLGAMLRVRCTRCARCSLLAARCSLLRDASEEDEEMKSG